MELIETRDRAVGSRENSTVYALNPFTIKLYVFEY